MKYSRHAKYAGQKITFYIIIILLLHYTYSGGQNIIYIAVYILIVRFMFIIEPIPAFFCKIAFVFANSK